MTIKIALTMLGEWRAFRDDDEEEHSGWGRTKEEAVADLMRLDEERYEAENMDDDRLRYEYETGDRS